MRYAIVIEQADANYSAYVPDLPGCIATGATIEEVEQQIREAVEFHLDGMREDGVASGCRQFLNMYVTNSLLHNPQVILRLQRKPALCRRAKRESHADCHFRTDTSATSNNCRESLAADT